MAPLIVAAAASRTQMSCAISLVTGCSRGRSISRKSACTTSSSRALRNADCSSAIARPCRKVPSNTGSPVLFTKSANTTTSRSVSGVAVMRRCHHDTVTIAIVTTAAPTSSHGRRCDRAAAFDSSRSTSPADCHRRPGSVCRHPFTIRSSAREPSGVRPAAGRAPDSISWSTHPNA